MRNTPQNIPDLMKDWEAYLKANPKNFIRIKDLDKSTWVTSEGINPTYFNWEDILSKHPDTQHWFDQLILKHALGNILVYYKRTNGSSSVHDKERKPEKYDVSPRRRDLNNAGAQPANNTAVPQQQPTPLPTNGSAYPPAPTNVPANPDYQFQVMQHMGGLGAAGLAAGLGYRELVELEKKAEMSDQFKEERDRLRKDNDILVIENRELKGKVNNATTEKDLAIRLAQMESKSWADPDMIKSLIQTAGPIFAQAMQKGKDPAQIGMGAGMNLTPPKQKFVEYLADPEFPDEKVNVLEGVLVMLVRIPGFEEQLQHLINQQYADKDSNS